MADGKPEVPKVPKSPRSFRLCAYCNTEKLCERYRNCSVHLFQLPKGDSAEKKKQMRAREAARIYLEDRSRHSNRSAFKTALGKLYHVNRELLDWAVSQLEAEEFGLGSD